VTTAHNIPQLSSKHSFSKTWNSKHITFTSSPHYPRSNGLAEHYVKTAKNMLKKCKQDDTDVDLALLMRRTSSNENLPVPSERLLNRKVRTSITITKTTTDISQEKFARQIASNRERQKVYADMHTKIIQNLNLGEKRSKKLVFRRSD
jgi:hypothetical protein